MDPLAADFLAFACWDNDTHGRADHHMCDRAAQRLLAQHPWIARHNLYTAIVCGEVNEVERRLDFDPELARSPGGPRGWTPLLYLCFTRFSHPPAHGNAAAIAEALLRRGADPNAYYPACDTPYSCLVGAAGQGEQDAPRQPQSEALYRLLLQHGAGPYDQQVVYNTHFNGDVRWWLELTYEYAVALGRQHDWDDPAWPMFDMGGYGTGAYFLFNTAIRHRDLELARWMLAHGARPGESCPHPRFHPEYGLVEWARMTGQLEMAQLLLRNGADVAPRLRQGTSLFTECCLRGDRAQAQALARSHPELLRAPEPWHAATSLNSVPALQLLLDLGGRLDTADASGAQPLHTAAFAGSLDAVNFLLEHGADVNAVERRYNSTPFGWASYHGAAAVVERLLPLTNDVWALAFHGHIQRLAKVLESAPELALQVRPAGVTYAGYTPLWWLAPDDEAALAAVELFLQHGADPAHRNPHGRIAADWARKLGLRAVADRLVAAT